MKHRYLRVDFGDNDFGAVVQEAIERVSRNVYVNNAHCLSDKADDPHFSNRTIADIFFELHKAKVLVVWLERAVDAIHHYSDIEFATRGLYWKKVDWKGKQVSKKFKSLTDNCLSLKLSFKSKMSNKWCNGEVVWLDMHTGAVVSR